ncbi:MAG TPA: hypothetical protein VD735_03115 [Candidatus Saccharimonadales bacterium]|nr:hypothetical protein [Candidatus Saccharimonadales bacterium]
MKRKIGTVVLFSLTILTVVAIQQVDTPKNHAAPTRPTSDQTQTR